MIYRFLDFFTCLSTSSVSENTESSSFNDNVFMIQQYYIAKVYTILEYCKFFSSFPTPGPSLDTSICNSRRSGRGEVITPSHEAGHAPPLRSTRVITRDNSWSRFAADGGALHLIILSKKERLKHQQLIFQHPVSRIPHPASGIWHPASDIRNWLRRAPLIEAQLKDIIQILSSNNCHYFNTAIIYSVINTIRPTNATSISFFYIIDRFK